MQLGVPKSLVTSQFPQKISIQIILYQGLQKRKKEETTIDLTLYKGQLSEKHQIIFFSPLPYSGASNMGKTYANLSLEIVTSSSVLDHLEKSYIALRGRNH